MTIRLDRATQAAHASATMHGRLESSATTHRGVGPAMNLASQCQGVDDLFRSAPLKLSGGARTNRKRRRADVTANAEATATDVTIHRIGGQEKHHLAHT